MNVPVSVATTVTECVPESYILTDYIDTHVALILVLAPTMHAHSYLLTHTYTYIYAVAAPTSKEGRCSPLTLGVGSQCGGTTNCPSSSCTCSDAQWCAMFALLPICLSSPLPIANLLFVPSVLLPCCLTAYYQPAGKSLVGCPLTSIGAAYMHAY